MRAVKFIVLPLAVFVLIELNSREPVIRFTNESANSMVAYLVLLLPALSVVFSIKIPKSDFSKAVITLSVLPIACVLTLAGVIGIVAVDRTPIQRVEMNGYRVQVSVTDCGAPCSFGIVVWQEKEVLPGILLVRELWGYEPAYTATFTPIDKDTALIRTPEYFDGEDTYPAQSQIVRMKPYVYF